MPQWFDRIFRPRTYERNVLEQNRIEHAWTLAQIRQATHKMLRKAIPFLWPTREDKPLQHLINYTKYVSEGFNANALVYACIMYKVRAITAAPIRAYTGTRDQPEPLDADHDLMKLLDRPNTYQSQPEFQGLNEAYLNIDGNSFILVDRDSKTEMPIALYPLRPDRVWVIALLENELVIARKNGLAIESFTRPLNEYDEKRFAVIRRAKTALAKVGYIYTPEGISPNDHTRGVLIPSQDMMHVKMPNLLDPLEGMGYGLSPLSPAAHNIDMDNAITLYFKELIDKMLKTMDGLLDFNVPLDDDVAARLKNRWEEMYGGEVGITDENSTYKRIMLTPEEMDLDMIDQRNETRICMVFGVPSILVGARTGLLRSTYENYREARKAFWQDTMVPELGWFEKEYKYYLSRPDEGIFVRFDLSEVPAFEDIRADRQSALLQGWNDSAVTMNEYRRAADLPPLPGGDVLKVQLQTILQPVFEDTSEDEVGTIEAAEDSEEREKSIMQTKRISQSQIEQLWIQRDGLADEYMPILTDAAFSGFEQDRRNVLQIIMADKEKSRQLKQTIDWEATSQELRDYFLNQSSDNWSEIFIPQLEGLVTSQANLTSIAYGLAFDVINLFAGDWLNDYTMAFADEIAETSSVLINEIIQEAQVRGWSIPQVMESIETLFKRWVGTADCEAGDLSEAEVFACERLTTSRLELIARDQTLRASNAGTRRLYEEWGEEGVPITGHEWLTTRDGRERATHAAANGQKRPIDEPFDVGGYNLMYPGDDSMGAPIEEWIQCRCQELVLFSDEFP